MEPYLNATSIQTSVWSFWWCWCAFALSLNINQDTDNIHEIPPYSMHLGPLICTMDITIQYNQPTVQFDPLTCSFCMDFACFYVEFAFRHYAKKSWKSKLKKKLTSCKYVLLKLRENLVQARPRVVVTSNFGICQVEISLNRGWCSVQRGSASVQGPARGSGGVSGRET